MKNNNYVKKWLLSALTYLVIFFLIILISYFIGVNILGVSAREPLLGNEDLIIMDTIFYSLCVIGLILVYRILLKKNLLNSLKDKRAYLLFLSGIFTCFVVSYLRSIIFDDGLGNLGDLKVDSLLLIYSVFIVVIFEELFFRKYLVELSQALGMKLIVSCLVSAILFALWHSIDLKNSWFLIVSALLYSYVTYLFRSISFAVGLHLLFNMVVIFTGVDSPSSIIIKDDYNNNSFDTAISSIRFDLSVLAFILIVCSFKDRALSWYKNAF